MPSSSNPPATDTRNPFGGPDAFHHAFFAGLQRLLAGGGVGAFILVLANAHREPHLWQRLREPLAEAFAHHRRAFERARREGQAPQAAADDQAVFAELMALGLDRLQPTQQRPVAPFELHFNPLRALRPRRMAGPGQAAVNRPFDPQGFHFNKPFLAPETLWAGPLGERPVRLLYNKFPLLDGHCLLVPEPEAEHPQRLDSTTLHWAWALLQRWAPQLPGIGLGYNAYGAYASVNHLHLQSFVRAAPLPVEQRQWRHQGGARDYPTACHTYSDPAAAWAAIAYCHRQRQPYNLLLRPGRAYLFPRARQGSVATAPWSGGLAWLELAGVITAFTADTYQRLDATAITTELARQRPGAQAR